MEIGRRSGARTVVSAQPSRTNKSDDRSPAKLRGLDSNPQGAFGPQFWAAFRDTVLHLYTVSLQHPADEARFTLATRTYPTPRAILMRTQGTGFIMTRGPALVARGADQLLILLQIQGSVETDCAGRRSRIEVGDVAIFDYARPYHSVATDYANLIVALARESAPGALLTLEPHGLVFPQGSGAARLIGAALQQFYAQADELTVSEADAAIEGIVALTTACARARLAREEAHHVKSRRKAALDYIDAHLGRPQLGPGEIANAANVSRASLYRLLAAEGGIRAVLLTRRLDEALRLMLADDNDEWSLKEIARRCGFAGTSQFSRAFRARFGSPPGHYLALLRQQDLEWHETRLMADGFDRDAFLWRQQGLRGPEQSDGPG
jgi:AraC-like DNA-binding protein